MTEVLKIQREMCDFEANTLNDREGREKLPRIRIRTV